MNDKSSLPALPDRLSVNPRSRYHVAEIFEHNIGIRLNGKERHDVEEYCISEGWVNTYRTPPTILTGHPYELQPIRSPTSLLRSSGKIGVGHYKANQAKIDAADIE